MIAHIFFSGIKTTAKSRYQQNENMEWKLFREENENFQLDGNKVRVGWLRQVERSKEIKRFIQMIELKLKFKLIKNGWLDELSVWEDLSKKLGGFEVWRILKNYIMIDLIRELFRIKWRRFRSAPKFNTEIEGFLL